MAHELPPKIGPGFDDLGVNVADLTVEGGGGSDPVFRQYLHDAPNPDSVAVVALRPAPDIGVLGVGFGPFVLVAGNALIEGEELDVGDDPEGQTGTARPAQLGALGDRRVRKGPIGVFYNGYSSFWDGGDSSAPSGRRASSRKM